MKTATFSGRNVDLYAQLNPVSSCSSNSWDNSGNSSSSSSSSSSSHLSTMSANSTTCENGIGRPFLKIIEQPTSRVRFRYITEQKKIHGAIKGENSTESEKTFPTVKLCSYDEEAYIRCMLYSADENNRCVHANRLLAKNSDTNEDKDDPHDIKVGPDNNYIACFQTMVVIQTRKGSIIEELVKKLKKNLYRQSFDDDNFTIDLLQQMKAKAKQHSQDMDMSKVCLRFDALKEDPATGELIKICEPVYSQPIMNSRNPATSDLKICRIDKWRGSCNGDEEVFMFVEKVCKGNIEVRFFELNEDGIEEWFDYAKFKEQDVHHQYAIAFRTPPYKDKNIDKEVTVYFQLERPSDNCVSEKRDFQYKPQYQRTIAVKRKAEGQKCLQSPYHVRNEIKRRAVGQKRFSSPFPQSDDTDITLESFPNLDLSRDLGMSESEFEELRHSVLSDVEASVECSPLLTRGQETDPTSNENFMEFVEKLGSDGWEIYKKNLLDCEAESERPVFSNAGRVLSVLWQQTPLHIAAKLKLEKSVALLLSYEADPSIQDVLGNTPLHYATMVESINIVKKLVYAMESADIEARNEAGQTVLHIAVGCKSYEIVETLLEAGADVNWYNGCTGDTPLHIAVKNRDLQMLHILLKADGIDVNAENFEQRTPLTCLLDSDSMEAANKICNALLEFKIKHNT